MDFPPLFIKASPLKDLKGRFVVEQHTACRDPAGPLPLAAAG